MTAEELKDLKEDKLVDSRGTACPGPLLAVKQAIGDMQSGEIMQILSSDTGTKRDIPRWCNKQGHEYLGDYEEAGIHILYLKKA